MRRIAFISIVMAAAVFGVVDRTSAETTVPMADLALVNESPAAPGAYSTFPYPTFHYPTFHYPASHYPKLHYPIFKYRRRSSD